MKCLMVLLLACIFSGCSTIQAPTANVVSVTLTDQSDLGAQVQLLVALENPNDVPVPLRQTNYNITLGSVGTFSFSDKANRTLPADSVQTLTYAAAFETGGRDVLGATYSATGSVSYVPPGEVRKLLTDYGIPLPRTSFTGSGKVKTVD